MTRLAWRPPPYTGAPYHVVIPYRRAQVLAGPCRGLTNADIGAELYITQDTVKTHLKRLFADVGAANRTHMAWLILTGRVNVWVPEEGL